LFGDTRLPSSCFCVLLAAAASAEDLGEESPRRFLPAVANLAAADDAADVESLDEERLRARLGVIELVVLEDAVDLVLPPPLELAPP
jgi:hypothetical protein